MLKKILKGLGLLILLAALGAGGYVFFQVRAYGSSTSRVYEVAPLGIVRSADPAVLERGKHLVESLGGCTAAECHGEDLGGGKALKMGPLATLRGPNITPGGVLQQYSDGELGRLIIHGIKRDGRSVIFMPAQDWSWWPDADLTAVASYLRTVPPVERVAAATEVGILGKVLDRRDMVILDIARRIPHDVRPEAPTPAPTAAYGAFVARSCMGCHGEHLSGGRIPGTPSSIPIPTNLTPDASGLKGWTYENFEHLLATGLKPDGKKLDPFMPYQALSKMNETERRALWAYLQALPAKPFGDR